MPTTRPWKHAFFWGFSLSIILFDQITKYWIVRDFYLHESVPVFKDFFHITYIRNVGAAFGILSKADPSFRVPFFFIVPVLALGMILWAYHKLPTQSRFHSTGLGLIFGGAIGNVIDRIQHGFVVDFLDFFWNGNHFPAFNIADSAICVGVGLMMLDLFKKESPTPHASNSI